MVDPGRHVDDEAVGEDPLGHGLPAHEGGVGGGDIEDRGVDQFGKAELAQNGKPRADSVLNVHGVRLL